MSITIFNKPGLFMGVAAFGAALALRLQWPNHIPDNVLFTATSDSRSALLRTLG